MLPEKVVELAVAYAFKTALDVQCAKLKVYRARNMGIRLKPEVLESMFDEEEEYNDGN